MCVCVCGGGGGGGEGLQWEGLYDTTVRGRNIAMKQYMSNSENGKSLFHKYRNNFKYWDR